MKKLASEIMTTDLTTVSPETKITDIFDIFRKYRFHHLPVINWDGKLVGIISNEDVMEKWQEITRKSSGKTWTVKSWEAALAKDIMTKHPITINKNETIAFAAALILTNSFHAIPITDEEDKLLGIITSHDLIKNAYQDEYVPFS